MLAYNSVLGVAVLLLHLWGAYTFPTSNACPVPCLCQEVPLLNCSSLGMTRAPTRIPATAVSLNISNNALRSLTSLSSGHVKLKGLLHLYVGSNALQSLSLFSRKERLGTRTLSSGEKECTSWAPDLQLLSAERNHLKNLPRGLSCVKSLQILQLSYNQISELVPANLANCTHLKELYLQHNRITSIHPRAFIDIKHLKVLDLSYNLLATIPVPAYQSLRNLNALVDVSFNKWMCDCNLQTLRRWIGFDVVEASWQVVCAYPPQHAGKDLLHLKDSDLTCPTLEYSTSAHYQTMIVDEGMQILISCSNGSQDYMQFHWSTPLGQVTDNQPGLLIKDITEEHAGLYVCVPGLQGKHILVFDLHVYKKGSESRLRREAPAITDDSTGKDEDIYVQRNDGVVRQGTRLESDFILAVCLSVIITFIVAFILGVFLRPLLDKLWNRIRSKRQSTPPTASRASSSGSQIYVNEGYSEQDDQEREVRVGSRVTFSGITEVEKQGSNVPCYVTVEDVQSDGSSESNTEVDLTYENIQKKNGREQPLEVEDHRGRADSSKSSSLQEGEVYALVINGKTLAASSTEERPNAQNTKVIDFESIPDADDISQLKRRSSSSASSHSSQSQGINFSKKIRDSTERSVDPPTVNISANETNIKGRIPGFTEEPFSEWLTRLRAQNVDDLDRELWNDNGESFSFNEGSERSSMQDLSSSVLGNPLKAHDTRKQGKAESPSDKINLDKTFGKEVFVDFAQQFEQSEILSSNSSESGDSEGGPNNYIVNPEEQLEILNESDTGNGVNHVTLNRISTLEDVTLNENSQPGAGILIRQETITIDPPDINLTFPHGDSVEEGMHIDDSQRKRKRKRKRKDLNELFVNTSGKNYSHEGLPLYHVHPVYRANINRLNKDYDIDRSSTDSSSKDEEQFTEYPRKLAVKIEPGINRVSITTSINTDNILNLDFDNSSSSTDVFEKKRTKGLTGLRALHALLFNRHENETENKNVQPQVQTVSTTNLDVGRTVGFTGPSFNRQSKLPEKTVQQTTNEDSFFGRIELSFDQLPRPKKSFLFTISDSQSPNQLPSLLSKDKKNAHEENAESESRRMSFSSEDNNEEDILFMQSLSLDQLPKVKRYIQFSDSDPQAQLPSQLVATIESRRSSSSSEDNAKQTTEVEKVGVSYDGLPKVKRYIEFSSTEPYSTTQPLNKQCISPVVAETESWSSTSSEDKIKPTSKGDNFFKEIGVSLDRVLKVNRHIQFKQPESYSPTLSSSPLSIKKPEAVVETISSTHIKLDVKTDPKDNSFFDQTGVCFDNVPKVKQSIQFKQSQPLSPTLPSFSTASTKRNVTPETKVKSQANIDASPIDTSSLMQIKVSSNKIQKVKRYIKFRQSELHSPTLPSSPSSTKMDVVFESKRSSTSSEDEEDNFFRKIGVSSDGVSKVKRHIAFKQFDPSSPSLSVTSSATKIEATTEARIQSIQSSTSKDYVISQNDSDTFFAKLGSLKIIKSFDGVPKIKQYLQFRGPEPHTHQTQITSLPSTTGVVRLGTVATEFMGTNSSFENRGNPTAKTNGFGGELGISLDRVPQVKRYLQFKQPVSNLPDVPPTSSLNTLHGRPDMKMKSESTRVSTSSADDITTTEEDNFFGQLGVRKVDKVPKVKRYINFTQPEIHSPAQSTTALSAQTMGISTVAKETRRLSSSCSEDDVKPSGITNDNLIRGPGGYIDKIPKVKRYVKFTQSESSPLALSPFPPSNTDKSIKLSDTELKGSSTLIGDNVQQASTENQTESRILSSSSEDDATVTVNKYNLLGQTGDSLDRVPKVKRYIHFTQRDSHYPGQTTSALSAQRVGISGVVQKTKRSSSTSEDDVKTTTNDNNIIEEPAEFFNSIPKVKRYIKFTRSRPSAGLSLLSSSSTVKSIMVTETELRGPSTFIKDDVQPAARENQTQSMRLSTSPEDDATLTAKQDDFFGRTGAPLDKVPKVKRYIHFTQTEHHSPAQSKSALSTERVSLSGVAKETWRYSTSSNIDNKTSSNNDNFFVALEKIPKVKRYIAFSKSESFSQTRSQAGSNLLTQQLYQRLNTKRVDPVVKTEPITLSEHDVQPTNDDNNFYGQIGTSFSQLPKVKRYVEFKQRVPRLPVKPLVMEVSPVSMKNGSASVIQIESESRRPEFSYKDNMMTRQSIDRSVQQTGLKPELRKVMNIPPALPQTPPPPLEQKDSREYLRDNSLVRQRQERRQLLQQKRNAMDEFNITSISSLTQQADKQDSNSLMDYGGATSFHIEHTYSNVSTGNTVTSRHTDVAEVTGLQGLKTTNISQLRSKSASPKYKEFLI